MCLNCNNNTTVAPVKDATAMTRVSTSGQCTYLYKVRPTDGDSSNARILFQSTYLYKVRRQIAKVGAAAFSFQSTYLYKVRQRSEWLPVSLAGFNPRTYIRYDGDRYFIDRILNVSIHVPI